jgi:coenzyme PQQ synthesis protein D (PqqD)
VSEAIDSLATEFGQPRDVIERDVLALCRALSERGLIARDAGDDQS